MIKSRDVVGMIYFYVFTVFTVHVLTLVYTLVLNRRQAFTVEITLKPGYLPGYLPFLPSNLGGKLVNTLVNTNVNTWRVFTWRFFISTSKSAKTKHKRLKAQTFLLFALDF